MLVSRRQAPSDNLQQLHSIYLRPRRALLYLMARNLDNKAAKSALSTVLRWKDNGSDVRLEDEFGNKQAFQYFFPGSTMTERGL